MARKRREEVKESEVTGTTYSRKLQPLVERLQAGFIGLVVGGRHSLRSGVARGDHCEIIAELGKESERRGEELVPLGRDPRLQDVPGWRAKRSCSPRVRNFRHSLRTRDDSPRKTG